MCLFYIREQGFWGAIRSWILDGGALFCFSCCHERSLSIILGVSEALYASESIENLIKADPKGPCPWI